ncbi:MAG TPA: SH3 domain-containing protein [Blastocatellia bacterium]|nr:SH3 domain-containing protein [Blastocatellia bacterium]
MAKKGEGVLRIIICLSLVFCGVETAPAAKSDDDQSDWRGFALVDSLAIYSKMSPESAVVGRLKKGEAVRINLEITGADGIWCSVTGIEDITASGYVRAEYLEKERPASPGEWRYLPPPEPVEEQAGDKTSAKMKASPFLYASKDKIRIAVEQFYARRFGRSLPISAYGQTGLHSRMGFSHHNAFDVPLHPDGIEGRALISFLREQGIPFIAFRRAVRGAATGPHVHIGRPSPRR